MVASAVIVPENAEQALPVHTTGAMKRRQSSISEADGKRPRLSVDRRDPNENGAVSITSPTEQSSGPPQRRGRAGKDEEKARGKRLFGGLLGTLSQSSSSTAQKRRAEIEQKQQAKLRIQAEADDDEKKRKLEELTASRRVEQIKYDKRSVRRTRML